MQVLPSIASQAAALQAGHTSSQALTEAALSRIADPAGEGTRVFTKVYAEQALAAARASDTLRAAGLQRSCIDGLPVSIKDLFDVAGEATLAGSRVLRNAPAASEHAAVVKRLLAAGAVIVGRTNMTEFAYSGLGINPHYGTPRNPWDRETGRIPGGSSSGAAVSVSDGMALVGIGSDTGGSIRIPAALCGLTGFKPTARRIPAKGALPLSTHLDSLGPIAKSVHCCALFDAILADEDFVPLPPVDLAGLRLAVPTNVVLDGMDEQVANAFRASLSKLSGAGARIIELELPSFNRLGGINAKGGFTAAESWTWHREWIERAKDDYDPRVVSRILRGKEMTAADFIELLQARVDWIAATEADIATFDALLMPTVPVVAPRIDELSATDDCYFKTNALILRNPAIINFLDGCALSVPCHAPGTAPVGLMIAGAALNDQRILAIGQAVEVLLGTVA